MCIRDRIWCDKRTGEECQEINDRIGAQRLIEITANPAITGFTASKILWAQKHLPKIYEKAAKLLLPKDYIRYKLTGEFATEVSDASGMQLLDISNRCWSDEMLKRLDIDKALLAPVFESCEVTGKITRQAAELTGRREGTPVVGGAGYQAAGAVGNLSLIHIYGIGQYPLAAKEYLQSEIAAARTVLENEKALQYLSLIHL